MIPVAYQPRTDIYWMNGRAAAYVQTHRTTDGARMRIAVLGVGHIGSTVGRLWYAAGHEVTFAGRDEGESRELAAELGDRAHAAPVADAVVLPGHVVPAH